jgi:hypothetical protein
MRTPYALMAGAALLALVLLFFAENARRISELEKEENELAAEQDESTAQKLVDRLADAYMEEDARRAREYRTAQQAELARRAAEAQRQQQLNDQITEQMLRNLVTKDFFEPSAAEFRNTKLVRNFNFRGGNLLCGEVNAKNEAGGYVGFRPFLATEAKALVCPLDISDPESPRFLREPREDDLVCLAMVEAFGCLPEQVARSMLDEYPKKAVPE